MHLVGTSAKAMTARTLLLPTVVYLYTHLEQQQQRLNTQAFSTTLASVLRPEQREREREREKLTETEDMEREFITMTKTKTAHICNTS